MYKHKRWSFKTDYSIRHNFDVGEQMQPGKKKESECKFKKKKEWHGRCKSKW